MKRSFASDHPVRVLNRKILRGVALAHPSHRFVCKTVNRVTNGQYDATVEQRGMRFWRKTAHVGYRPTGTDDAAP